MIGLKTEVKKLFSDADTAYKYFKTTIFLLMIAFGYNLFIIPIDLVAGGSGGIGVLFNFLFDFDPSVVIFVFSVFMFFLSFFFLDGEQTLATLFVALIYPLFIKTTTYITFLFPVEEGHTLLMVVFGAIVTGYAQGQIFKCGLNFGGTSIIAKVICKYNKFSVTLVNLLINGIIVLIGGYVIGLTMVLYAVLFLVIIRLISEKVILGKSNFKTFKIITNKYSEVVKFIEQELGHDVTIYNTYGAHNGHDYKLLMSVIPTSQFIILRDYVESLDSDAFIFIMDTYNARGLDEGIKKETIKK